MRNSAALMIIPLDIIFIIIIIIFIAFQKDKRLHFAKERKNIFLCDHKNK